MSGSNLDYDIDDDEEDLFEDAIEGDMDQEQEEEEREHERDHGMDVDLEQSIELDTEEPDTAEGSMAIDEDEGDEEGKNKNHGKDSSKGNGILENTSGSGQGRNQESKMSPGTSKSDENIESDSTNQPLVPLDSNANSNGSALNHNQQQQTYQNNNDEDKDTVINFDGTKRYKTFRERYPIEPSEDLLQCSSYDIVPYVAAIHGCPIHCMAFSWGMKWMFTGGQDGFIRKYNFMDSINGKLPLTVAQRHQFVDSITKSGVLTSYWENEQPVFQKLAKVGSDGLYEPILSPVYSLAVQSEALWLLAGLESGGITLQTVRHSEGQIQHYLDKHTSAVSCLKLDDSETIALSGSWDKTVVEWDLNTGTPVHQYIGASGQISSLEWQPKGGALVSDLLRAEVEKIKNHGKSVVAGDTAGVNGGFSGFKSENKKENDSHIINGDSSGVNEENDEDDDDRKSLGSLFGDDDEEENENAENPIEDSPIVKNEEDITEHDDKIDEYTEHNEDNNINSKTKENNNENQNDNNIKTNIKNENDNDTPTPATKPTPSTVDSGYSIFLTSCIDGTIDIWDRRQRTKAGHIPVPESTPPWCMSACWSTDGNFVFAGRRNGTVDEFDIRSSLVSPSRAFKFPSVSGAVSSVTALPNNRHILCASHDNVRLYDLKTPQSKKKVPFFIIPGHHGAVISNMYVDPGCNYMVSASGSRGWQGNSTDVALVYEIRPL